MPATDRFRLDPDVVRFGISAEETDGIDPGLRPDQAIGQPRAVEALRLALAVQSKGYNVFCAGPSGTGKRSTVMRMLREQPLQQERLRDIAFVNNFVQPDKPRVLYFSAGDAMRFKRRVEELIDTLRTRIPQHLDNGDPRAERDRIMMDTEGHESQTLADFERRLRDAGFAIMQISDQEEQRSDIGLLVDGEPRTMDEMGRMAADGEMNSDEFAAIRENYYRFMNEMNQIFASLRGDRMAAEHNVTRLQREAAQPLVADAVQAVKRDFVGGEIGAYLDALANDVVETIHLFLPTTDKEIDVDQELMRYGVNIIVDHADTTRTPVVFESHPDYQKLFGAQEVNPDLEGRHGFLSLRGGSIHTASGGYLVLRAEDVLSQEEVWNGLKRALQDEETEIRTLPMPFGGAPMQSLKPEPIELKVKVVLLGSEHIYDLLFYQDDEFGKHFKVLSEFDSVMPNTDETRAGYIDFMRMICTEEKLLPVSSDGKAAVLEYGVRLSEFRDKLSTHFSLIADLLRESSHWARMDGRAEIDRAAVERARSVRRFLHNLPEEKYDEQILSGEMILQVDGTRIGAINGLSVLDRGYYAFGRPMLITARVAPGTDGITNIERESGLSGELHDKGVYIIQGFLQATYATDFPLSLNASIGFEQSYVEVDGDSASSTEIYVLLSAIGDVPLRQDLAVTGSVNQFGQIQPVGGISEKIEGFYDTCKLGGLTGTQGVVIPRTNIQNLILSREVQDAVAEGRFHIYAIDTVSEGIEILTGIAAGERGADGHFPKRTMYGIVERRLRQMAQQVKDFS